MQQSHGYAADEHLRQGRMTSSTHDDEIGTRIEGLFGDHMGRPTRYGRANSQLGLDSFRIQSPYSLLQYSAPLILVDMDWSSTPPTHNDLDYMYDDQA